MPAICPVQLQLFVTGFEKNAVTKLFTNGIILLWHLLCVIYAPGQPPVYCVQDALVRRACGLKLGKSENGKHSEREFKNG